MKLDTLVPIPLFGLISKGMELEVSRSPNWVGLDSPHFREVSSPNLILIKKFQASPSIHRRRNRKIHIHRPLWSQERLTAAGISPATITTNLYAKREGGYGDDVVGDKRTYHRKRRRGGGETDLEEQGAVDKEI